MSGIGGTYGEELEAAVSDEQRRRLLGALQRLIRASQAVTDARETLDRQYRAQVEANADPHGINRFAQAEVADYAHLNDIRRDLDELRGSRRVFRKSVDQEILALELAARLALSRLGFDDFEDLDDADGWPRPPEADGVIDLAYLEFAERELESAKKDLAAVRRGQLPRPAVAVAAPTPSDELVELVFDGIGDLEPWAGPPPLPQRILPRRKQPDAPELPIVKFASLPRLPQSKDEPPTMWSMWSHD